MIAFYFLLQLSGCIFFSGSLQIQADVMINVSSTTQQERHLPHPRAW